ncbi:MAG: hypothetical protein ABIT76_00105 [Chthoniobacterales bacterium]
MQTDFPFVEIPTELYSLVGKPDSGTRMYRRDGSQEEAAAWFELITEIIGPSVSPGGVGMYCPVSRAAVYKRIKEGKLSIFLFHVTYRKTTLFGKNKILRENPYGYVPASEAKAWRQELEERAVKQGAITIEDLEGSKPDWHGEFLQWQNKNERMGLLDSLEVDGESPMDFLISLAKMPFQKPLSAEELRERAKARRAKDEDRER